MNLLGKSKYIKTEIAIGPYFGSDAYSLIHTGYLSFILYYYNESLTIGLHETCPRSCNAKFACLSVAVLFQCNRQSDHTKTS